MCSADGCISESDVKGLCRKHYQVLRRHGDANYVKKPKACSICAEPVKARGLCSAHYWKWYRHGDPAAPDPVWRWDGVTPCIADSSCVNRPTTKGMCEKHYQRNRKHGDPNITLIPPQRKGWSLMQKFWDEAVVGTEPEDCWEWSGSSNEKGYSIFYHDDRRVRAHRVAGELLLGPCPAGLETRHLCGKEWCVNPNHLAWGTHAENMADRWGERSG